MRQPPPGETWADVEIKAMRMALKDLGGAVEAIGFDRPFSSYSEEEAFSVVTACVMGYQRHLAEVTEGEVPF